MTDAALRILRFDAAMLVAFEAWKREVRYVATRFREMIASRGGVETARRLLRRPGVSAGFTKLSDAGRLDLTIEYLILQPDFSSLFTFEERGIARQRLMNHGMAAVRLP
jgi:hypothetical protein